MTNPITDCDPREAQLDEFATYKANWNHYSAEPITAESIRVARTLLPLIPPDMTMVPTCNGGVQFESATFNLEIMPDGKRFEVLFEFGTDKKANWAMLDLLNRLMLMVERDTDNDKPA